MSRRMRAVLLSALLALAVAPAARAQGTQGEPVVGGGSFADAPLLEPGAYRDTMLPGERLFYGVRLEPGQQLRVAAGLDVEAGSIDTDTAAGFSVGLQTPLREVITETESGGSTVGSADERLEITFPTVLAASGARDRTGAYFGPGVWYLSLYLSSLAQDPARVEFPVEFELEVIGEPQPDAAPEPTPAKATPGPEREPEDEDGGTSGLALAGIGIAGLLAGLAGGALAGRRA
jgi:Ca-activated chloride channel family protein